MCVCVALLPFQGFTQDFGLGEGGEKCSGPVRTAGCVMMSAVWLLKSCVHSESDPRCVF